MRTRPSDRVCLMRFVEKTPGTRWLPCIQHVSETRKTTFEHASSIVSSCVSDGYVREERRNVRWVSQRCCTFEAYLWPNKKA